MNTTELTSRYITSDWGTDNAMPAKNNIVAADPVARWGEIFYNIDPSCTFAHELEKAHLYRVTIRHPSGMHITAYKPTRPSADWHETYWELHHSTDYVDDRGRRWSANRNFKSIARVRPWARTARAVADDIQRRVIEPASKEHTEKLLDIEQLNEGLKRQAHTAHLSRKVLGNILPDTMYPNTQVNFRGDNLSADIRILEGGDIEITKLTFADTETALDALETLFTTYEQTD